MARGDALRRQYEQMSIEELVDVMRRWCRHGSSAVVESFIEAHAANLPTTADQREESIYALVVLAIRYYDDMFFGIGRS